MQLIYELQSSQEVSIFFLVVQYIKKVDEALFARCLNLLLKLVFKVSDVIFF